MDPDVKQLREIPGEGRPAESTFAAPMPARPRKKRLRLRRRELTDDQRERRRLRIRRHGRRAYIRSIYSLPSLATLGNAICGFGAIYVAAMEASSPTDRISEWFFHYHFVAAAYLVFVAMLFDAVDGRLARFTRHTTDFGGQLDSLADVVSFGVAPAFVALQVFGDSLRDLHYSISPIVSRAVWAVCALYMSCAALRLARFNVSNEHGEQHHFSFLGLPSPGAGGVVAAFILMQQDLAEQTHDWMRGLSTVCLAVLPLIVLMSGLLMVSNIRYPHLVNRYMRGRRSFARVLVMLAVLLLLVIAHRYTVGIGTLIYMLWGLLGSSYLRLRRRAPTASGKVPAV
ncbi:MAG TPA: phosphatidylcholine/phosphatidylserine synthase [Humisphaera sp.]|jgi:CDP-diacylglycerol--serine O-phosphatidyltransferase|nr:phosphatidylcholine/phosphatidylserine synthase [Humisphaera sp.]